MANKQFFVTWEMDIAADSPVEAAKQAWAHMRRPDSTANSFKVFDEESQYSVNLQEIFEDPEPDDSQLFHRLSLPVLNHPVSGVRSDC